MFFRCVFRLSVSLVSVPFCCLRFIVYEFVFVIDYFMVMRSLGLCFFLLFLTFLLILGMRLWQAARHLCALLDPKHTSTPG